MIKKIIKEYVENEIAYNTVNTYFFGIPVYKRVNSTTNASIVTQLKTEKQKHKIIKGYEIKDKSKKNQQKPANA